MLVGEWGFLLLSSQLPRKQIYLKYAASLCPSPLLPE